MLSFLNLSSVVNYIRWRSDLSARTSFFQTPGLFMGVWFGYLTELYGQTLHKC